MPLKPHESDPDKLVFTRNKPPWERLGEELDAEIEFLSKLPPIVGYWVLYPSAAGQTKFAIYKRPTDEQIKATEQLLGWGWEDET
jgi:hypothetical protein